MVPFKLEGTYTVKSIVAAGEYKVLDTIAVLTDADGKDTEVTMVQKWPVKKPIIVHTEKPRPFKLLETGVRTIDTANPIVEGGTGFIPGPFGTGKTVLQHAISKQAEADIVIIAACGERANEVVEIFVEFPELEDPHTGRKLMERTIIIANTIQYAGSFARSIGLYRHDHFGILPRHGFTCINDGRFDFALGTSFARNE
jgi:V/A-type H+-transporting ATPase subunit A